MTVHDAWCTTKSLTLPIMVLRSVPIPRVPVIIVSTFSSSATVTMASPGFCAGSTLNTADTWYENKKQNLFYHFIIASAVVSGTHSNGNVYALYLFTNISF